MLRVGPARLPRANRAVPCGFRGPSRGDGRHDNPHVYGCLYLAESVVSSIVEQLAPFRGNVLVPGMFVRRGLPSTSTGPRVLTAYRLRPSRVATRRRELTQPQALALYRRGAVGIRWWSTFESLWANITLFDRAAGRTRLAEVRRLAVSDPSVREATEFLGIAPAS